MDACTGLILLMTVLGYAELKHVTSEPGGSSKITPSPVAAFRIVFNADEQLQDTDSEIIHIVKREALSGSRKSTPEPVAAFRILFNADGQLQVTDSDIFHMVKREALGGSSMINPTPVAAFRILFNTDDQLQDANSDIIHVVKREAKLEDEKPMFLAMNPNMPRGRALRGLGSEYVCRGWQRPLIQTDESEYICTILQRPVIAT